MPQRQDNGQNQEQNQGVCNAFRSHTFHLHAIQWLRVSTVPHGMAVRSLWEKLPDTLSRNHQVSLTFDSFCHIGDNSRMSTKRIADHQWQKLYPFLQGHPRGSLPGPAPHARRCPSRHIGHTRTARASHSDFSLSAGAGKLRPGINRLQKVL